MAKVLVSLYSWENPKLYHSDFEVSKGDKVIVATEYSNEIGIVEDADVEAKDEPQEKILRVATKRDQEVFSKYEEDKEEYLEVCRQEIKKTGLEMKLIDARINLDGKQAVFAFTADGRVDFREMVKTLT